MSKPKLPKRPKQSASIATLQNHIEKIKEAGKKYREQLTAAKKVVADKKAEIAKRKSLNEQITKERAAYAKLH